MRASLTRDRKVASGLLLRQLRDDGRLDRWLGDATSGLPGEESRRVRSLVYGINRNRSFLEAHLEPYLKRPMDKQQPAIQIALLLGSYELLFQDGVPDRAAVSQAVQLVRERGHGGQTGLVNAILRRLSRRELVPTFSDRSASPVEWAVRCASHPRWLVERMARLRSEAEAADWAEANNRQPPLWIRRAGPMATVPDAALESPLVPGALALPAGSGKRVAELPGFSDGDWWVQDLAAQAVALLVAAQPGQRVLDACAAPGGKSFAVGAAVGPSGRVLALDSSARRLEQLRSG
ncbi:MAG: transcription antitermination factor NusB, partial [Myxococcota bacterium]|nr:transcription antitermination factor NusB [Myxococcota bacterium]